MCLQRIQSKEVGYKLEYEIQVEFSIKWEKEQSYSTSSIMCKSDWKFNRFVAENSWHWKYALKSEKKWISLEIGYLM